MMNGQPKRSVRMVRSIRRSPVLKKRSARVGIGVLVAFTLFIVLGPFVITYPPDRITGSANSPPSPSHIFGTDFRGFDIASQIIWGAYPSTLVGLAGALGSVLLGLLIGVVAGYFGRLEAALTGTADVVMTIPAFPLLILVGLLFPDTNLTIAGMLVLVLWPPVARAIRSQVLSIKNRPYLEAAKTSGMSDLRILAKVVIPEVGPIAFAYFVITVAISVVFVVGLEFVGVGNVDEVTWGSIFYWAQQIGAYNGAWWWVLAPGLFVIMFATSFALIGYAVEEVANPRLRT